MYTLKSRGYEDHEAVLDLSQTLQTNLLSCDRKHRKMKCSYDVSLYHVDNYKIMLSVILRCILMKWMIEI